MTHEKSVKNTIQSHVEAGELAGAAALIWRDGTAPEVVTFTEAPQAVAVAPGSVNGVPHSIKT